MPGEGRACRGGRGGRLRRLLLAAVLAGFPGLPPTAAAGGGGPADGLAGAVEAIAPGATSVSGGWRFRVQEVVVSVLADEGSGLLRVVARTGELSERDVGLVAAALGADPVPDLAARVVSVRGLVCSAVLAPLRGLTDAVLRQVIDGAVRAARDAAVEPDLPPIAPVEADGPAPAAHRESPRSLVSPLRADAGLAAADPTPLPAAGGAAGAAGRSPAVNRPNGGLPVGRLPLP